MRAAEALGRSRLEPREARQLLAAVLGCDEVALIAHPETSLPEAALERFCCLAARRCDGEPFAYLVGEKEFHGLALEVSPAVLIPRPETELLVDLIAEREPCSVLDLGTGSGAIALAVKRQLPQARVLAIDASRAALDIAQRNAVRLGLDVELRHGSWFAPVAGERFECVVSNPPYVASGDPHLAALRYEPQSALDGGPDGLEAIRRIVAAAAGHLSDGGWLLLEHGFDQAEAVRRLLEVAGFGGVDTWLDLAGIARVSGGKLKC